MERIQSINLARIDWCCAERGITRDQLAQEMAMAPASLAKVMAGEGGLTFNQLRKLAAVFGRGTLFFLEPEPVNAEKVHSPQFRTLTNQKPELSPELKLLIERVERQRAIYLGLREDLDLDEIVRFLPPRLPDLNIPEAAAAARRWLGLGDRNDFVSYRRAVEACGVLVFRSNGYAGDWQIAKQNPILGFSLYDAECPVIVVKKQDAEARQTFTLMHELGHLLLHRASSIDEEKDLNSSEGEEAEANAFAGNLLIPGHFLQTIRDEERPANVSEFESWLEPQRKAWGVSTETILRRLLNTKRLSSSIYGAYRNWSQERQPPQSVERAMRFRSNEPRHVFGDSYVRTVLDALNSRRITLAKASNYLDNLKIADLHKLERHYAGV